MKDSVVVEAVEAIVAATLSPTEHKILSAFIEEAVDPRRAAAHILTRIRSAPEGIVEEVLRDFKREWHELAAKCVKRFHLAVSALFGGFQRI